MSTKSKPTQILGPKEEIKKKLDRVFKDMLIIDLPKCHVSELHKLDENDYETKKLFEEEEFKSVSMDKAFNNAPALVESIVLKQMRDMLSVSLKDAHEREIQFFVSLMMGHIAASLCQFFVLKQEYDAVVKGKEYVFNIDALERELKRFQQTRSKASSKKGETIRAKFYPLIKDILLKTPNVSNTEIRDTLVRQHNDTPKPTWFNDHVPKIKEKMQHES